MPEYLPELDKQNLVAELVEPPDTGRSSGSVSTTDPDAAWAVKWGLAALACYDNGNRVILAVEATPALGRGGKSPAGRCRTTHRKR